MCPKQILESLFGLPFIIISQTAIASDGMHLFYLLKIFLIFYNGLTWLRDEESIMSVSGRMSLGLEQSIKIPERTLDVPISLHFLKPHLHKHVYELLFSLHQHM